MVLYIGLFTNEGETTRMTDHVPGTLKVTVIRARSLPDTDGWLDKPDPYAKIIAYRSGGSRVIKTTRVKRETQNPVWNQELTFGYGKWVQLFIEIWDEDGGFNGPDNRMVGPYRVEIVVPCSNTEIAGNKVYYSYYVDYSL